MAEWQEQLNTILSDPEAMAQIAALAQSITGGQNGAPADGAPADGDAFGRDAPPPPSEDGAPPFSLDGLDPELLRRIAPLMREMNRPESGQAAALLAALRPYLSEKRRGKVERAAQMARLIHLGKTFLTTQGEEGRV